MAKESKSDHTVTGGKDLSIGDKLTYDRLIRRKELIQITGIPSSSITYLIEKGDFPAPVKLSERMSAWRLSWVLAWIEKKAPANREVA